MNLADFVVSLGVLAALFLWYGFTPGWQIVFLPVFAALAVVVCLGPGLLFSALNVQYRDIRYVVPYVLQVGLYLSPVAYGIAAVPQNWRLLFSLNPVVGVIEGFRWSVFGGRMALDWRSVIISAAIGGAILVVGYVVFNNTEKNFADVI